MTHVDKAADVTNAKASQPGRFERVVLPHLSAGFTLAMYLTRNTADAEDAVQEAVLRAVRYFPTLRDDDARAWFLTIVRRVCFTGYGRDHPPGADVISIDDAVGPQLVDDREQPDEATSRFQVQQRVRDAIDQLPPLLREAIVLRELQDCSYTEIATVTEVPIGTVMSRLSRARSRLAGLLHDVVDFGDVA
ncbi:MAG: sigma-70 family RNA polymerase sigma factor [Gemmatimonadota bacterium]|nr:sigma-70 family RNA polymerase sigma factor [Gemmatimonadota bacterium]